MKKFSFFVFVAIFSFAISAQAQINLRKIGEQVKKEVSGSDKGQSTSSSQQTSNQPKTSSATSSTTSSTTSSASSAPTATIHVSESRGGNRNDGSKDSPIKDLQKAVDVAPEGALILVAQGNYQGKLDVGFIEVKKYLSFVGGYSDDFSQRDPIKYKTTIRPGSGASGTSGNNGLFDIYVKGKRNGVILIDGFILDKGELNLYCKPDPSNPKSGTPEGCETGRLVPPGFGSPAPTIGDHRTHSSQLIHGDVEGQVTIRNCVLMNGSHFAIQMGNDGGHFDIYNNLFLANRMAACEIRGMPREANQASVDFHNNTVLFVWRRDPMPGSKDMGYGFRYMTGVDANVYNNIFGCIDFSALDRSYVDADKNKEALRKTSAWDNLFFSNLEADLTLPGSGMFQRIFSRQFEDVDQLIKYEGNMEMNEAQFKKLAQHLPEPYLKGFLSMDGKSAMEHNPNSSENQFRSAMGMPQRGTSSYTVSMYMNRYPLEEAQKLFGALEKYGAQKIK